MRVTLAALLLLLITGCASAPCQTPGEQKIISSRCSAIPGCAGDRLTTKVCNSAGEWKTTNVVECSCG